jgi:hypothetical protein
MRRSERARALVARARKQLTLLREQLDAWDADLGIESSLIPSAFGARSRWTISEVRPPNPEFEFDLFDALGNFAKALDRTVALFAEARGVPPERWHGSFPIAVTEESYLPRPPKTKALRQHALGDIDPDAGAIIDAAQPYLVTDPHDAPLALVARWSRYDKHRLGHPAVSVARGMGVAVINHSTATVELYDLWRALNLRGQRPLLAPGTDLFSLFPAAAIEPFRHLLVDGPAAHNCTLHLMARVAVAFGEERDTFFDVVESLDDIEERVLEPLWSRLDQL